MKLKSLQAVEPLSGSGLTIGLDLERGFGGRHSWQVQLVSNPVNARVVTRESRFGVGQVPAQCHRQKGAGVGVEVLGDSTCAGHAESHNRQDRSHQDTSNPAPVAQRGGHVIPGPGATLAPTTATGAAAGREASTLRARIEAAYGAAMLKLARAEGKKPKMPGDPIREEGDASEPWKDEGEGRKQTRAAEQRRAENLDLYASDLPSPVIAGRLGISASSARADRAALRKEGLI